jgi:hypothetical protein
VAGAAAPLLAQPRAVVERAPLRMALAAPAPREVEQLGRRRRHGQPAETVATQREHARLVEHELGRPDPHAVAVALDGRSRGPDQQWQADVVRRPRQRRRERGGHLLHIVAEVSAPVQDRRTGGVEEERDAAGPQMDQVHQATGCRSRRVWSASPVSGSKQCTQV